MSERLKACPPSRAGGQLEVLEAERNRVAKDLESKKEEMANRRYMKVIRGRRSGGGVGPTRLGTGPPSGLSTNANAVRGTRAYGLYEGVCAPGRLS